MNTFPTSSLVYVIDHKAFARYSKISRMPTRRTFLISAGAVPLLAGCLGQREASKSQPSTTTGTSTPTATPSTTSIVPESPPPTQQTWGPSATIDGTTVTADEVWVQHTTLSLAGADQMDVARFGDRQLLFVSVSVVPEGPVPTVSDFNVAVGETRATGYTDVGDMQSYRIAPDNGGRGKDYSSDTPDGWLAFSLPTSLSDIENATFSVRSGTKTEDQIQWPVPDSIIGSLRASPPALTLEAVDVPDTVAPDEPFDVTVTVANAGGPGVFRAAVNETGPLYAPHPVRMAIDAQEKRSTSISIDTHVRSDTKKVQFRLVTTDKSVDRTVEVKES